MVNENSMLHSTHKKTPTAEVPDLPPELLTHVPPTYLSPTFLDPCTEFVGSRAVVVSTVHKTVDRQEACMLT